MTQHEQLVEAIKSAKARNNELTMTFFKEEKVTLIHEQGFDGSDNTIRSSLTAITAHGYYYSDDELSRVLNMIYSIK